MSWVDLIILIVVILAALRGFAEGAIRQVVGIIGFGAGFLLGTIIAPSLSTRFIFFFFFGIVGGYLGGLLAKVAHVLLLGLVDRIVGVVIGVVTALIFCWLAAGLLATTTWGSIASGIQHSKILSTMDDVMPPVPSIVAKVEALFPKIGLPNVFARVVAPTLPTPVNPKDLGPLVTSVSGPSSIQKVFASGACSYQSQGTAFFVTPTEAVTNAHVVAGFRDITVGGVGAEVALYDPKNDLAVLRVPSVNETPLKLLAAEPSADARVSVIGFPLDRSRTSAPGRYEGEITGLGRDIYDQALITKTLLAIEVNVNPGNSGSPVLVHGEVAGVVESKLLSEASTAYAIPLSVIESDLVKAPATGPPPPAPSRLAAACPRNAPDRRRFSLARKVGRDDRRLVSHHATNMGVLHHARAGRGRRHWRGAGGRRAS